MIQKAITKYGLAFHLAVLAALPSVLALFVSDYTLARVILWLSVIGVLWLFVEPTMRFGEHLSTARRRVWTGIVRDPVFWFFSAYAFLCALRWINSGIGMVYNSEAASWEMSEPLFPIFPASVGEEGFLPFAVSVGCMVVVLGLRHAVGLAARVSFAVSGSVITGLGGCAATVLACSNVMPFAGDAAAGFGIVRVPSFGTIWGIWFLISLCAGVQSEHRNWRRGRPLISLAIGGNLSGLLFYSPSLVTAAYLAVGILYVVYSWAWLARSGERGAVIRNVVFVLLGGAMAFSVFSAAAPEAVKKVKTAGLDVSVAWRAEERELSAALNGISRRMWLNEPWCGAGLGAFPLRAQFVAESEDWEVLPPKPERAVNGYWNLLSERGNVMCGLFIVGLGLMLWAWGVRLADVIVHMHDDPDVDAFPFSCPPVVWLPLFFLPLLAVEGVFAPVFSVKTLLLVVMASLALATASFPRYRHDDKQKEKI